MLEACLEYTALERIIMVDIYISAADVCSLLFISKPVDLDDERSMARGPGRDVG